MPKPNFQENDTLLSDLLNEVQKWEGTLAGGTRLRINAEKVDNLFQSKISFGNPRDRLILLRENTFKDSGTELDSIYNKPMQEQFEFYYMTLNVHPHRQPYLYCQSCLIGLRRTR